MCRGRPAQVVFIFLCVPEPRSFVIAGSDEMRRTACRDVMMQTKTQREEEKQRGHEGYDAFFFLQPNEQCHSVPQLGEKKNCNAGSVSALRQDEEEEEKRHVFTWHSAEVATTTTANVKKKKAATFSSLQEMQVFILPHFNNSSNKTHTHPINEACNFDEVKRVKEK